MSRRRGLPGRACTRCRRPRRIALVLDRRAFQAHPSRNPPAVARYQSPKSVWSFDMPQRPSCRRCSSAGRDRRPYDHALAYFRGPRGLSTIGPPGNPAGRIRISSGTSYAPSQPRYSVAYHATQADRWAEFHEPQRLWIFNAIMARSDAELRDFTCRIHGYG